MKREELKVGGEYVYNECKAVPKYIGDRTVVYTLYDEVGEIEATKFISTFLTDYSPVPKEPKKLGRLYICIEDHDLYEVGDLNVRSSGNVGYWQPVTINEKGEVFEVVE